MPRVTITVPGKKAQPYRFALDRKSVSLGRGSENDIVVECGSASVSHAVMERVEGGYELRDLGSTNGTKLDGKAVDIIPLADGLPVKLGDVEFGFSLTPDEQLALAKERPEGESPIIAESPEDAIPPAPPARPVQRQLASANTPGAGASFFMTLLFLLLAGVAFFIGMSVRYTKETGKSGMLQAIMNGEPATEQSEPAGEPEEPAAE